MPKLDANGRFAQYVLVAASDKDTLPSNDEIGLTLADWRIRRPNELIQILAGLSLVVTSAANVEQTCVLKNLYLYRTA